MATNLSLYSNEGRTGDGPAMRVLTDRQREFVLYYVGHRMKPTAAARKAGFASPAQYSWTLMRDPNIVAAVREETEKLLVRSSPIGAHNLIAIAETEGHKDQLKASRELLAHAGLAPVVEQKMTVEHTTLSAQAVRDKIKLLMSKMPEASRLLESAGLVVDAEFSVVSVDPAE